MMADRKASSAEEGEKNKREHDLNRDVPRNLNGGVKVAFTPIHPFNESESFI